MFSRLEKAANELNIKKLQLSLNDDLFSIVALQELKNNANTHLKNIQLQITPKITIITEEEEKCKLLQTFHDDPISGGHSGVRRLMGKLRQKFYWKNMTKDVTLYVRNCKSCQTNKAMPKTREKLTITNTPQRAFDIVIADTIGPFIKSNNGNEYAVTIICDLTKYLVTIPVENKSAKAIARAIFEKFILVYGPMKRILTAYEY